jgi:hypothetical protein
MFLDTLNKCSNTLYMWNDWGSTSSKEMHESKDIKVGKALAKWRGLGTVFRQVEQRMKFQR